MRLAHNEPNAAGVASIPCMTRPATPSSDDAAERSLGDLLTHTARTLRRRSLSALEPWGVTPHEARTLRVVGRDEPTRPGVVAEHLRIAPRSVTDVVDALEHRDLVARKPDPDDRRATRISLTASGRTVLDELDVARRADHEAFFAALGERDRATLERLLRRLLEEG